MLTRFDSSLYEMSLVAYISSFCRFFQTLINELYTTVEVQKPWKSKKEWPT